MQVPENAIEDFRRDGVAVLRGVFADWVEALAAGLARNQREPSPTARYHTGDGEAAFFNDYCNWDRIPEYQSFIYESPAAEIAAELMHSDSARFFHEHVVLKEAGNAVPTPWHQDQPYYCVQGEQTCSFWIPLDPVPREIAIEYVAGSHLWGKQFEPQYFSGKAVNEDINWDELPDIDAARDQHNIVGWAVEPGDAIAFDFRTVHGAPANITPSRRAAIAFRFMGSDARFAERGGKSSPPFPHLDLRDGDDLNVPEFPLVWPRDQMNH
ncbi:MAG: phytanoyl-CoA dioxygenase [Rhodospirillaceae bacterium]|jgi:ectoine hydroxylase-related dioxygenase (phytanoyl-CoA dioxygenase family)|nr:phytanoyl-CoA dioxygenase [Rhodospirillaceae bacterium]